MSSHPLVLFGKANWLFLNQGSMRALDQIANTCTYPDNFDEDWRELFEYRRSVSRDMGFKYVYSVAPNKECVYQEFLPDGIVPSDSRPVYRVLQAAEGLVEQVHPLVQLRDSAQICETYMKGDTHWNHFGAFIAVNSLLSKIGVPEIQGDEISFREASSEGDLSSKIGRPDKTVIGEMVARNFALVENNRIANVGNRMVFENRDRSLPRCVFFRDSFATRQIDMLASRFSRLVLIWQPNIDYSILRAERPDFVVNQNVERFLLSVPDDLTGPSHAENEARKRQARAAIRKPRSK